MAGLGRSGPRPRSAFAVAVAIAVGVVVYLLVSGNDSEADYQSAVARFGQDRIDRLVTATMPLGFAKHCHDAYGEDTAMIETVAAQVERNQAASAALVAELEATATMTDDEKLAIEQTVIRRVDAAVDSAADCRAAMERIAVGAFDLAAPPAEAAEAQPEGN